jgi:uncharacterized protein YbjQ (UPF0145 family)
MLVVTTENVAGHRVVEVRGQCFGVVVRSRGLGGNIMAGLRSIVGGEIDEYTQLLEEARRHAVDRLVRNATAMGANAVLMMRFVTPSSNRHCECQPGPGEGSIQIMARCQSSRSATAARSALKGDGPAVSAAAPCRTSTICVSPELQHEGQSALIFWTTERVGLINRR